MENNYQEIILEKYHSLEAVRDCFAISRIQTEINLLSQQAAFNKEPRKILNQRYDELDAILIKYKDVVQLTR